MLMQGAGPAPFLPARVTQPCLTGLCVCPLPLQGKPSRVIVIRNAVAPGQVDDDLEEEMGEELSKYGKVADVVIFEVGGGGGIWRWWGRGAGVQPLLLLALMRACCICRCCTGMSGHVRWQRCTLASSICGFTCRHAHLGHSFFRLPPAASCF